MSRETSRGKATVRLLCETFSISTQAYYAAGKSRKTSKVRSIATGRKGKPTWATAAELEAGIRRVVEEHPAWGVRKVWAFLRRQGVVAGKNRVWAMMRAMGLVLPPPHQRDPDAPRGHVVVAESNRRWASDLTTTWTRRDGLAAIVPVIDCGDRMLLEIEVGKSQESPAVLAPTERSLHEAFGSAANVPDGLELRTDHGPQFTGSDCDALCKRWRLEHTLAPVGRPTGNAVAERVIQTMKVELLWTRDFDDIDELREAITAWMRSYNYARPHQALDWKTPAEVRAENLGIELSAAA